MQNKWFTNIAGKNILDGNTLSEKHLYFFYRKKKTYLFVLKSVLSMTKVWKALL